MKRLSFLAMIPVAAFAQSVASDVQLEPLADGFVKVKTKAYTVEVPKAWAVGGQTPWGARSITPEKSPATELGVMTAGVTKQSWDQLYKTSLFFIQRQEKGTATPYKLSKTATGYEACSFQVADDSGFVKRKYVLLKSPKGEAIALSVIIGNKEREKEINRYFDRMVRTAHVGS